MPDSMLQPTARQSFSLTPAQWIGLVTGMMLATIVAVVDKFTTREFSMLALYLPPVIIGAWLGGRFIGVFVVVFTTVAWTWSNYDPEYQGGKDWELVNNSLMRAATFWIIHMLVLKVGDLRHSSQDKTRYDAVTGLPNRAAFFYRAAISIGQRSTASQPMAMALVDIRDLHGLNRKHGQQRGDLIISLSGHAVRAAKRPEDVVARTGGDEFVLLMPNTSPTDAAAVLATLRQRLGEVGPLAGCKAAHTIVLLTMPRPPLAMEDLLNYAEGAVREHGDEVRVIEYSESLAAAA